MRPVNELTSKKRDAIRLRLNGASLAQIKAKTGLSVPTIIKAVDTFKKLGWQGVEPEIRGRKPSVKQDSAQQRLTMLSALQSCSAQDQRFVPVPRLLEEYAAKGDGLSKKTLLRRLEKTLPDPGMKDLFERIDLSLKSLGIKSGAAYKSLILGFYQIEGRFLFYTQDRRGERRFFYPVGPSENAYLDEDLLVVQLTALVKDTTPEKPFLVLIKTDTLSRYGRLKRWQAENQDRCCLIAQGALVSVR